MTSEVNIMHAGATGIKLRKKASPVNPPEAQGRVYRSRPTRWTRLRGRFCILYQQRFCIPGPNGRRILYQSGIAPARPG